MAPFTKKIEWIFTFVVVAKVNTTAKTLLVFFEQLPLLLVYTKVTQITHEAVKFQVLAPRPWRTSKMATLKGPDSRTEVKFPRLGLTQIVESP